MSFIQTARRTAAGLALSAGMLAGLGSAFAADTKPGPDSDKQFFPIASYRVGPYASAGAQIWAAMIDYLRYVNEVEGGINGVKIVWQECETEWTADKGIECYERHKHGLNGAPVAIYLPNGAPAAYALTDRAAQDKIPLITLAYGRTEATDGRVFPYIFPVILTFYSEASALVNYIAEREGGLDKLKGKKIATVYHDSAYGRETLEPLALLAKTYGFENIQILVADPGNEQSSQWRQVREAKPDWVFLRTWGSPPRSRSRPRRASASPWTASSATSGRARRRTCCRRATRRKAISRSRPIRPAPPSTSTSG